MRRAVPHNAGQYQPPLFNVMPHDIPFDHACQASDLRRMDILRPAAVVLCMPRFYFHKHYRVFASHDEIHFSAPPAHIAPNGTISLLKEMLLSHILAPSADCMRLRHNKTPPKRGR